MASKASPAATDRQDCAGLRSRPACLPAVAYVNSIRLADPRCCPKDGDTKTLSLSGTKKAASPAAILCERRSEATEGDIGESIPRALGLSGGLGIRRRCPFAAQKKQPGRLLFCASEGTRTHTHKGTRS